MKIAGMTPEEWAKDVHTVILLSENPVAILTALVERIHCETALELTAKMRRNQAEEREARIDAATRFNGETVN